MKQLLLLPLLFLLGITAMKGQTRVTGDRPAFLKWAETPPLGWNSWDCYGPTVVESEVKANADYMAAHMKTAGWQYIVVDIRWYVENDKAHGYNETDAIYVMDEWGRLQPSPVRFPSAANGSGFKPLADYIHAKGLKFGIHVMRGIPIEAVKKNTPILGSKARAADVYSPEGQCPWLKDMYTVVAGREGAQAYYNSLFRLYAGWGVDFVKIDDLSVPYHQQEIEMIRKAIDGCGRPIVLSTSPGETPIANAQHVMTHANMWRIVGDFWDNWGQLKEHFAVCDRWSHYIGEGHFPDADMLPLGRIGIRAERGDTRMSAFTRDEQYTLMSLFAIFRSPLMVGGDLPGNDPFTLSLLTNQAVLAVNRHSANNHQLFRHDDLIAWTADIPGSRDKYLALFNASDQERIYEPTAAWKSDLLPQSGVTAPVAADVALKGAKKIWLVTTESGGEAGHANACWLAPVLIGKDTLKLTALKWEKAPGRRQRPGINKSVNGKPLMVNDQSYPEGIGVNGSSMIVYSVPEGYTRFQTNVGLDRQAAEAEAGKAGYRFMVFTRDPAGPLPADSVQIPVAFKEIGLKGGCMVTDLWSGRQVGSFENVFNPWIRRHGAGLYRVSPKQ